MAEAEGIPPTASVASVGPRINYLGSHCYGYSGSVTSPAGKAFADMLSFDTGSGYIFSEITFMQPEFADVTGGTTSTCKISFNGAAVAGLKIDSSQEDMTLEAKARLIIPPFTTVLIEGNTATGDWQMYATFTGVVYDV